MMFRYARTRGQAVVEMAIFGSIIVFVLGVLVAYVQKLNDQQYIKMEVFRRALQKANTFQGEESESPGASVEMFLVQNRRHADIAGEFGKGNTQTFSSDANVFWAVPTEQAYENSGGGGQPQDLKVVKINDDQEQVGQFTKEFFVNNQSDLQLYENLNKAENPGLKVDQRNSTRQETLATTLPEANMTQYSYRDPDGQYRYYKDVPPDDQKVQRVQVWVTGQ